ncbi:MAG: hypothetical protein VB100_08395 [Angelakisella sp.]|nr:hypothetical protein [Angelakisella sp.]
MLREKLKEQKGMALGMVLGLMVVIAILATGLFVFSSNQLHFSNLDMQHAQADYLARAGVEIAAKTFPQTVGEFDMTNPVTTKPIYLTQSGDFSSSPDNSIGSVTVNISSAQRTATDISGTATDYTVWLFEARARIGNSGASAKGYTLPVAYVAPKPDETSGDLKNYVGWTTSNQIIMTSAEKAPNDIELNSISGGLLNLFFGVEKPKIPLYSRSYYGGVVADDVNIAKLTMPASGNKAYTWSAPAIFIECPLDLRNPTPQGVNVLGIQSATVVFKKEVNLYANSTEARVGDLILAPMAGGTARVYFQDNVYLNIGSNRIRLFGAGEAYSFTKNIDLFQYAVDTGKASTGLSGWLRNIINSWAGASGDKYQESDMTPITDEMPTINALSSIVWE